MFTYPVGFLSPKVGGGYDADAEAYLNAIAVPNDGTIYYAATTQEITGAEIWTAVNTLFVGLKADGIYTKITAMYPFVGGTAATHKYNAIDPRDLDAAFRLTYIGTITHTATGMWCSGGASQADTKLNASTDTELNSVHTSFYSRTNNSNNFPDIGVYTNNSSNITFLYTAFSSIAYFTANTLFSAPAYATIASTDSRCYIIGTRVASNLTNIYRNSLKGTPSIGASTGRLNATYKIGRVFSGDPVRECAFATIGEGLTDVNAANLYARVQALETALHRQV